MNLKATSEFPPSPRANWSVFLGLAVLVGLAYSNSFQSGFVLDNDAIIKDDPRLRAVTWENIYLIFTEDYWYPKAVGALFRPITTLSLLFDYSICGYANNPTNYHWINLGCHLLNAFLFYALTLQLSRRFSVAVGAASLFALHPIATEAVTNIVGRADLFATSSVLAGTLLYIRVEAIEGKRKWIWLGILAFIVVFGVLSKENAIVIAGMIPLYDIVYHLRWNLFQKQSFVGSLGRWLSRGYLVLIPIVLGLFLVRYWMMRQHGPSTMAWCDNSLRATDFVSSRLTAVKILGHYLWLLVYPVHLSCDYSMNAIPNCSWQMQNLEDWKAIVAASLLAIVGGIIWTRYRHGATSEAFFAGWFCIAMLPTSNLLFLIDSNMAERFLYLPLVGFVGVVVLLLDSWISRYHPQALILALVPILCLFGLRTYQRNFDWQNHLTIWTSAAKICPESCRAQRTLAWAILQSNIQHPDFDVIIPIAEKAVRIVQHLPNREGDQASFLNLGNFLGMKADRLTTRDAQGTVVLTESSTALYERSIAALEKAKEIGEASMAKHVKNLIACGRDEDDIPEVGPQQVYENLAVSFSRLGRHEDAVHVLQRLQSVNPKSQVVYRSLPEQLIRIGNLKEAVVVLIQAMLLGFQNDSTMVQLASAYRQLNPGTAPAFIENGNQMMLNLDNPNVRDDLNNAFARLIELSLRNKDMVSAERGRDAASNLGCNLEPIDALFKRLGPKNGPWSIKK